MTQDAETPVAENEPLDEAAIQVQVDAHFEEFRAIAAKLVAEDPEVNLACAVLLYVRRLHGLVRMELQNRLTELNHGPAIERMIIGAMTAQAVADNELEDQKMLHELTQQPLLFLTRIVERNLQANRDAVQAEEANNDVRRRAQEIPLGFTPWRDNPAGKLSRDRPLILVGSETGISTILNLADTVAAEVTKVSGAFKVVRVLLRANVMQHPTSQKKGVDRLEIGANWSTAAAETLKTFDKFMSQRRVFTFHKRVDLILIEDMAVLSADTVYQPWTTAHRVNRILRQWMEPAGCAVIAGVPVEAYDKTSWKEVRPYADFLWLEDKEDGLYVQYNDEEQIKFSPHVRRDEG